VRLVDPRRGLRRFYPDVMEASIQYYSNRSTYIVKIPFQKHNRMRSLIDKPRRDQDNYPDAKYNGGNVIHDCTSHAEIS